MEFLSSSLSCSMAFLPIQSITRSFNLCKSLVIFELPSLSRPIVRRLIVSQITDIQKQHQTQKFPPGKFSESGVHPSIAGPANAILDALQIFSLSLSLFLFTRLLEFYNGITLFSPSRVCVYLCLEHQVLQKKLLQVLLYMHFAPM